jgi:peptide methionine sulfoxide reductase MsrB
MYLGSKDIKGNYIKNETFTISSVEMPTMPKIFSNDKDGVMAQKEHGTCSVPVQDNFRFGAKRELGDRISCYNRFFAEPAGYYQSTAFEKEVRAAGQITFYDSVTGKPLFIAPKDRSVDEFLAESKTHGWPSFRDQEVVWENVKILADGETVSVDGTHLGHNLPDGNRRNRYCINLVSIAGQNLQIGSA